MKLPPPSYEDYSQDVLLESSYEDDATDNESTSTIDGDIIDSEGHLLPPPPGFEYSVSPQPSAAGQFTLNSLPPEPPRYASDTPEDAEEAETGQQLEQLAHDVEEGNEIYAGNELGKNTMANQFLWKDTNVKARQNIDVHYISQNMIITPIVETYTEIISWSAVHIYIKPNHKIMLLRC